jgi:hypothetical protein
MKKIIVERIEVNEKKRNTKDCKEINELKERMKTNKRKSWYTLHCEQEKRNMNKNREKRHELNQKRLKEVLGI